MKTKVEEISIEQEKKIEIDCIDCDGTGLNFEECDRCVSCNGSGIVLVRETIFHEDYELEGRRNIYGIII